MATEETRTNSIGTRDWLKATKHMEFGAHVVSQQVTLEQDTQTHSLDFDVSIERAADSPAETTSIVS